MNAILDSLIALRDVLSHHALFTVGMLLVFGYFIGKLVTLIKLPEITGYIIAGLLMGDSFAGIVHPEMGESLKVVTDVALGLIALTIGGEFYLVKLKKMGKEVLIITAAQILLTFVVVTGAMFLFKVDLPFALLMGAIATATAPAATVAIVQSLRAKGPFVDYLYGIVALDDAGCVIVFGIVFAMVTGMLAPGAADTSSLSLIIHAFMEIFLSIAIGLVAGFFIHLLCSKKMNTGEVMIITLGIIFLVTAVAIVFHLSPLMANMAAGTLIVNLSPRNHRIFRIIEPMTPPIYALFFVIAGTELRPEVIFKGEILLLGLVYIVARGLAKYSGVFIGSKISRAPKAVKTYLGLGMLPQAGVAIGLVLLIQASPMVTALSPQHIAIIGRMVNIILLSVFVNELIGPPVSKFAVVHGLKSMEESA